MPIYTVTTFHAETFRKDELHEKKVLTAAYLSVHVYPSRVLQLKPPFISPVLELMFVTYTSLISASYFSDHKIATLKYRPCHGSFLRPT